MEGFRFGGFQGLEGFRFRGVADLEGFRFGGFQIWRVSGFGGFQGLEGFRFGGFQIWRVSDLEIARLGSVEGWFGERNKHRAVPGSFSQLWSTLVGLAPVPRRLISNSHIDLSR